MLANFNSDTPQAKSKRTNAILDSGSFGKRLQPKQRQCITANYQSKIFTQQDDKLESPVCKSSKKNDSHMTQGFVIHSDGFKPTKQPNYFRTASDHLHRVMKHDYHTPIENSLQTNRRFKHSPKRPTQTIYPGRAPPQDKSSPTRNHRLVTSGLDSSKLKQSFIDNSGVQMQSIQELTHRAQNLKTKTQSYIFAGPVANNYQTQRQSLSRKSSMQEIIHEYNRGPKSQLQPLTGKTGLQLKVTQHNVDDVKNNVVQAVKDRKV